MTPDNIIDVNNETFEYEVIQFSMQTPVIMDFWAPWCIPCRVQSPQLAQLAREAEGAFRLARVNVDDQPKLAERFKVKNVPHIVAIVNGHIMAEYNGVLPRPQLQEFIQHVLPDSSELLLEKGRSLLTLGQYPEARDALETYLQDHRRSPAGMLAYSRVLLAMGMGREASVLLEDFPASHEYTIAEKLKPLARAYVWSRGDLPPTQDPLEAAFRNGLRLARRGNILLALDGFLDILRKDKHFHDDDVREVYLALLEVLGDENPEVRAYRVDLSNVLF
ncbi:MAG TPA: tetratricopeptide repeat protein [Anaerolineaceae bacterium]|nr:tetratricopeptide repeat protein [Anaerolineaceae bacterium]HPT23557.1 tetratricopeptide repeat protein [Anaerolineaceae bacterium]